MHANRRTLTLRAAMALAMCLCASGCVERRLLIVSNPPGAAVFVDNQEIGTTPCATDFIYYGTRDIRLVKEGYETLVVKQPIPTPWYEYFPLDFFSENLTPGEIRDTRRLEFPLKPIQQIPADQIIGRAETLRRDTQNNRVVPASATGNTAPLYAQPQITPFFGGAPEQVPAGAPTPGVLPPPAYTPPIYAPQAPPPGYAPPQ